MLGIIRIDEDFGISYNLVGMELKKINIGFILKITKKLLFEIIKYFIF